MATKARESGGTVDCTLAHSVKSFLFNALMSCSTESSRMGSGVVIVAVNSGCVYHSLLRAPNRGHIPQSSGFRNNCYKHYLVYKTACIHPRSQEICKCSPDHLQARSVGRFPFESTMTTRRNQAEVGVLLRSEANCVSSSITRPERLQFKNASILRERGNKGFENNPERR